MSLSDRHHSEPAPASGGAADRARRRLVALLESEDFPPGARLPPERALCTACEVSRMTLRHALARLIAEGRVVSRQGSGTFVARRRPPRGRREVAVMCTEARHLPKALLEHAAAGDCRLRLYEQVPARWGTAAEARFLRQVRDDRLSGLLAFCSPLAPTNDGLLRDLDRHGVRVLHTEHFGTELPEQAFLLPDFRRAAHVATVGLMIAGYRHLLLVTHTDSPAPFERLLQMGFRDALAEHRPDLKAARCLVGFPAASPARPASAYRAALVRMLRRLPADCGLVVHVAGHADLLAEAAREAGIRVPEACGLIGIDVAESGPPTARAGRVDVLSFHRPAMLVDALDAVLAPEWSGPRELAMPTRVSRGSVRRPAGFQAGPGKIDRAVPVRGGRRAGGPPPAPGVARGPRARRYHRGETYRRLPLSLPAAAGGMGGAARAVGAARRPLHGARPWQRRGPWQGRGSAGAGMTSALKFQERTMATWRCFGIRIGLAAAVAATALAGAALAPAAWADGVQANLWKGMRTGIVATDKEAVDGRCAVADVSKPAGQLFAAATPALEPGVYDAVLRLKLSQVNNLNTGALNWSLALCGAAEARRDFDILAIERAGVYQAIPLRFTVLKAGVVTATLEWKRESLRRDGVGVRMRVESGEEAPSTADAALGDDAPKDKATDLDIETELALEPPIAGLRYLYCAVDQVAIVPVSDVAVTRLDVDKIRYRPGEQAKVAVSVRNYRTAERQLRVETVLISDLDTEIPVDERRLTVAGGAEAAFECTGPAFTHKWGYAVRCRVYDGERLATEKNEYFTVHDNMWAIVVAGRGPAQFTAHVTRENAIAAAQSNKRRYRNWVESGFWAPDEFGDFTPDTENWWGGQGCYYGSVTGTKTMIEEGHKAGISYAVYSNVWGGDGPPAFEMVRARPEWGWPSGFDVEWFDRWDRNPMGTGRPGRGMHVWPMTVMSYANEEPFRHHGRELAATNRMFGWDAVRYDSHAISDENARVVGIAKSVVHAEVPEFQFGYNSSVPMGAPEKIAAFKAECEGEGLVMEEGIRQFGGGGMSFAKGRTYEDFARRILSFKEETRRYGGHFIAIGMDKCYPNDLIYQYIFWLAANTHPCYDWLDTPVANYMQFATRFAGQLWDLRVTSVPKALEWVDFGDAAAFLWLPDQYIHQRDLGEGRRQVIIHLINAPAETQLYTHDDAKLPPPRENLKVKVRLPGQAAVRAAWLLTAEPSLQQTKLTADVREGKAELTVPRLRFWSVVVLDLDKAPALE